MRFSDSRSTTAANFFKNAQKVAYPYYYGCKNTQLYGRKIRKAAYFIFF